MEASVYVVFVRESPKPKVKYLRMEVKKSLSQNLNILGWMKINLDLSLFIGFEPQKHSNLDCSRVNDARAHKVVRVRVDPCIVEKM